MNDLTIQLTQKEYESLKKLADQKGVSIDKLAQEALSSALDKRTKKNTSSGTVAGFLG